MILNRVTSSMKTSLRISISTLRNLVRLHKKQNQTVAAVMKELAVLDVAGHAGDMLGDAYEYLIGQFATDSGKKAGEFYTPQPVAKLMTQIAFLGREDKQGFTLYDATMGSGSLLLNAKRYSRPTTEQWFTLVKS